MNAFLLDSKESAQICRQMIQLDGDCAGLKWSRTIQNIPENVHNALEMVQDFLKEELHTICTADIQEAELSTEQEDILFAVCRKSVNLKKILGSGVVLAGEEATTVKSELSDVNGLEILEKLLDSGKNLVLI